MEHIPSKMEGKRSAKNPDKVEVITQRGVAGRLVNSILYGVVIVKTEIVPLNSRVERRFIGSGRFDEIGLKNRFKNSSLGMDRVNKHNFAVWFCLFEISLRIFAVFKNLWNGISLNLIREQLHLIIGIMWYYSIN